MMSTPDISPENSKTENPKTDKPTKSAAISSAGKKLDGKKPDSKKRSKPGASPLKKPGVLGRKLAALGAVLGLLGVGLGGYALLKTATLAVPDNTDIKTEIARIETQNATLKTQIERLERRLKSQEGRESANADVSGLIDRIEALEIVPQSPNAISDTELENLQNDVKRLDKRFDLIQDFTQSSDANAATGAQDAAEEGGSENTAVSRIDIPLEIATRLEALEAQTQTHAQDVKAKDKRIAELEEALSLVKEQQSGDTPVDAAVTPNAQAGAAVSPGALLRAKAAPQKRLALAPFPEEAVRTRLRELDLADKPWWKKSLARHISVKKPGEIDDVDLIVGAIDRGEIEEAVKLIGNLPSQARSMLGDWVENAQSYIRENEAG